MSKERKMTQEYEVEVTSGRSTKRKKARSSAVLEEPHRTQKLALNRTPKQSQAHGMNSGMQQRPAIGDLFSEGSLNPYADGPYAFD